MRNARAKRVSMVILFGVLVLSVSLVRLVFMADSALAEKDDKGGKGGGSATDLSGVTQNWDKVLPADTRFVILPAFNNAAVRDNETGLVWEKAPSLTSAADWVQANSNCIDKSIANRKGWRLPSAVELATLIDMSQTNPTLPTGHPFTLPGTSFWSATTYEPDRNIAWGVEFIHGYVSVVLYKNGTGGFAWCVRGPMNADTY